MAALCYRFLCVHTSAVSSLEVVLNHCHVSPPGIVAILRFARGLARLAHRTFLRKPFNLQERWTAKDLFIFFSN